MTEETIESIVDRYTIGHKGGVQCKCISGARGHLIAKLEAKFRTAIQQEREKIFNLADGLVLEPENLRKQIEDYEKLLASLTEEKEGK